MTWEKWIGFVVDVLTRGWPAAAVVTTFVFRAPLGRLMERVKSAQFLGGISVQMPPEALSRTTTETTALPPATPLPGNALPALSPERASTAIAAVNPSDDPWRRCGHIYWLGNNIMFVALAIAAENFVGARRELDHAIHHAKQLPIDSGYAEMLDALARQNLADPSSRQYVVNKLVAIGSEIGQFIAKQQPDFR